MRPASSAIARAGKRIDKQCPDGIAVLKPGVGYGNLQLGKTSPTEAIRCQGDDADFGRSGIDITSINYNYDAQKHYQPDRALNSTRPQGLAFDCGVLSRLKFGPGQVCFETAGGLGVHSTRAAVEQALGANYDLHQGAVDRLHFPDLGIEFLISREDEVIAFELFPPGSERIGCPRDFPLAERFQAQPGKGYRGAILGKSTPEQVLAALSTDGRLDRHPDGVIYQVSYDYQASGRRNPDRPEAHELPSVARFDHGRLSELEFSTYQRCVVVAGLRTSSTAADMERVLGAHYVRSRTAPLKSEDLERLATLGLPKQELEKLAGPSKLESYDYESLGLTVDINTETHRINNFALHLPAAQR